MGIPVTEWHLVSKSTTYPRLVADLIPRCLGPVLAKRGFASTELITRWPEIVGAEVSACAELVRLQWPRGAGEGAEPATLILRVEGPAAVEVQHLSGVIVERVNRFFGWRAVKRIAIRQAPLVRRSRRLRPAPDPAAAARLAQKLDIVDENLRLALARLGAAIKRA
jgi:hypothetical protein